MAKEQKLGIGSEAMNSNKAKMQVMNEWMNLAKHPWKGKASCF